MSGGMSAFGPKRTPLARPKTGSGGLVHQIAQLIWTIEKVAVSGARLLRRQVEIQYDTREKVQHCRTQEVKIGPKEPEMVRHEL